MNLTQIKMEKEKLQQDESFTFKSSENNSNSISEKEKEITEIEIKPIKGTYFNMIKEKDDKLWKLVFGKNLLTTKEFKNEKEITKWIEQNRWYIIASFVEILNQNNKKL